MPDGSAAAARLEEIARELHCQLPFLPAVPPAAPAVLAGPASDTLYDLLNEEVDGLLVAMTAKDLPAIGATAGAAIRALAVIAVAYGFTLDDVVSGSCAADSEQGTS